jgi:hypothetical protein
MTVWAIDPGPHTGVFYMRDSAPHRVTLDYTDGLVKRPLKHLYLWLVHMVNPAADLIVLESFEFRKEDAKNREYIDYSTGEFVGVVKLYCDLTTTSLHMQSASEAKGFWDDDKLKRVELWVPGDANRHVRDATRHWLHYQTFKANDLRWLEKLK